jgi:hypothetical protein
LVGNGLFSSLRSYQSAKRLLTSKGVLICLTSICISSKLFGK